MTRPRLTAANSGLPAAIPVALDSERGEDQVCTSIIVAAELRFGAAKKRSERLTAQLETVLSALNILPFDEPADRRYSEIRQALERAGTPIGANDLHIARESAKP